MKRNVDIAVIGGGAAGLAAAVAAYDAGVNDVVVFEREGGPGGILKQCIHNGFGLHRFKEELTGPEYAAREYAELANRGIEINFNATVLDLSQNRVLTVVSPDLGVAEVQAKAVVLAMGSRERTRGALRIPGTRPAGIYTAGTAQHMINLQGVIPGKEIVMLGSGDIGLIVARRLAYEGAHVKMVLNRSHISSGLRRNIVQCLDDYGIPLKLNHTITSIHGKERVEAVGVSKVDRETRRPIPGTEELVPCDTVLLSVGLLPENELSRQAGVLLDRGSNGASVDETYQTSVPGVFSAGNVLHIHDLVDFVSEEGEGAGRSAARFVLEGAVQTDETAGEAVAVKPSTGVGYVVPQRLSSQAAGKILFRFRVRGVMEPAVVRVLADGVEAKRFRKRILLPAEMAEVKVDADLLAGAKTVQIEAMAEGGDAR